MKLSHLSSTVRTRHAMFAFALVLSAGAPASLAASGVAAGTSNVNVAEALHSHDGLPFLDVRLNADQTAGAVASAALERWQTTDAYQRRVAALQAVLAEVPDAKCDMHWLYGTPHFLRSTTQFLSAPSNLAPRDVVEGYLLAHSDLFETDALQLKDARIVRDFTTSEGLMHHVTLQQMVDGVDVYGSILRASVTRNGQLINVSSAFVPRPASGYANLAWTMSGEQALRAAARSVGVDVVTQPLAAEVSGTDDRTTWQVGAEFDHWTPTTSRRVIFAMSRDEFRAAYSVVVPTKGIGHTYELVVDAASGEVLSRVNWLVNDTTQPVTYRVYASDSPAPMSPGTATPTGAQAPHVARSLITVAPASIITQSPNGWIPDGGTTTTGNNVDAYLDAVSDNAPDPGGRPISATRVFDDPLAVDINNVPTGAPSTFSLASVTHGFYHANLYHDKLRALGFNEAAGNFQTLNFGLGGSQNDPVLLEMQDGGGTNNANFATPSDGNSGRCQMYIFTGPTPDRDGGMDQDILYHELTHGTSTRCHELTLSGTQAGSMGEGWGDFFGICLSAQASDDFNAVYAMGGYATYQLSALTNNYYFGIRRYPYSTDLLKSPLTYADIDVAQQVLPAGIPRSSIIGTTANEVHNAGEIWCNALSDCRASLGLDLGFGANDVILQVVVDGMKLAPSNPTMLQERDAILQSDLVRYGAVHQNRLWQGFAHRGMGFSATSPTGGTTSGIVEAFDVPERVVFTYPDGLPSQLSPNGPTTFRVDMSPQLLTITPGTQQLFISINSGTFTPVVMTPLSGTQYTATIPTGACFDTVRYYASTGTSAGTKTDPATAPAAFNTGLVFTGTTQFAYYDMETDAGWTVGPNTATTGIWNRMDPQPTTAQPGDDTTPAPGVNCWVTDGNAGAAVGTFDIDGGYTYLNSPTFDLSGSSGATIEYQRWYSNNTTTGTYGDPWLVEISNNNGSTWTTFESLPVGSTVQNGWNLVSRTLASTGLAPTAQMKMRFRAEDSGTASISEAAIDDMRIFATVCNVTSSGCDSIDFNGDGLFPDSNDIDDFLSVFSGGPCSTGTCNDIDFNNDGLFPDSTDIDSMLSVFSGGPCL